jgi:hypothetical protein
MRAGWLAWQRRPSLEAVRTVMRGIHRTIGTAKAPKASATNDRLLAMVASQKMESRRTKWVVESRAREGADIASTRNGESCRSPTSRTRRQDSNRADAALAT